MTQPTPGVQHGILAIILLAAVPGMLSSARAGDIDEAEQLFLMRLNSCFPITALSAMARIVAATSGRP
jgi:hypothetical protein